MGTALAADLRFALRQLRRRPAFALASVGVLALGLGVGAAMFTVLNAVLLRPIPYRQSSRLVTLQEPRGTVEEFWSVSYPDVTDWQSQSRAFDSIAFYRVDRGAFEPASGPAEAANALHVSPNLLSTLGVRPRLGRDFAPADFTARARLLLISDALWRKTFAADPSVVGRTVHFEGEDYRILGVMPPGFDFPLGDEVEVWSLFLPTPQDEKRDQTGLDVIARLRAGVTPAAAQAELTALQAGIARRYAAEHLVARVRVRSYRDTLLPDGLRSALLALVAAVGLVWLIACSNVTCLLLTGLAGRGPELSVRAALGARRGQLARLLLAESLLLGGAAALAGWALAWFLVRALGATLLPLLGVPALHLDPRVLAALVALTLLTTILVGAAPAWLASTMRVTHGLHGGPAVGARAGSLRLRNGLVVLEIALAMTLVAAAGLMLRTLRALGEAPLGFHPDHVVTASFLLQNDLYVHRNIVTSFYNPVLAALRADPRVAAAAVTSVVPLNPSFHFVGMFDIVGRPAPSPDQAPQGNLRLISADYLSVFGIPLLRGRFFDDQRDTPASPPVAVINQAFATRYFPGQNPLGHQFGLKTPITIVGVLANVREDALDRPATPTVYLPVSQLTPASFVYQVGSNFMQLAVRGRVAPDALIPVLRADLRRTAPGVPISGVAPMPEIVAEAKASQTLAARLLSFFGAAAMLIALTGLYGLLAYAVGCRTREFGVRLALGATPAQVLALVLRRALLLLGLGLAAGLALTLAAGRALAAFLYGVPPHDPLTLAAVALLLAAAGLLAAYLPARRAARLDPSIALRAE